jgi:hypothetical protein
MKIVEEGNFIVDNETDVRIGFFSLREDRDEAYNKYIKGVKNARIQNYYGDE